MTVIYTIESHWADLSDAGPSKMDGTIRVGAPIGAQGPSRQKSRSRRLGHRGHR